MNPSILFAFETHGEALVADDKKGIYMGIGLAPGYTFFADSQFPVTVSAPMTFGFSVKDYYTVNGDTTRVTISSANADGCTPFRA